MDKQLTVGSLFSGIGGLDLGLERAGMRVIWQSEIDPYASRVLKKHWPEVPNYGDIKKIEWRNVIRPNVICGGYPCQPFSVAGHRNGTDDPRHLWPWVRTAISELRPDYAILENVRGHLSLGGLSVIGDLAAIGYDAEWRIISAASVGANHRRDRLVIVAYPNNAGSGTPQRGMGERGYKIEEKSENSAAGSFYGIGRRGENVADTDGEQLGQRRVESNARPTDSRRVYNGRRQTGYDGWQWWQTEPDVGRVANGVPNRVDRLRGLGNAVVPQLAEVIGRLVIEHANNE
jgi:DNA (cytosine-5)-methyltransferase 1